MNNQEHRFGGRDSASADLISEKLLSVRKAAEMLGISASGMRRLQQDRKVPFIKVGRCVRFSQKDLTEYVQSNRVEAITRTRL